jgi:hypothetical protein
MSALAIPTLLEESKCYACFAPEDVPSLAKLSLLTRISQLSRDIEFSLLGTSLANAFSGTVQVMVAPEPNCLLLFFFCGSQELETPTVTVAGLGLTWVLVQQGNDIGGIPSIQAVYRAMATTPVAPGLVAATFTNPFAADEVICSLVQFKNVDTSGTNGSGAVVQSAQATGASGNANVALAAITPTGKNATVEFSTNTMLPYDGTAEAGWTEDFDSGCVNVNIDGMFVGHKLLSLDNTCSITSAVTNWWIAGLEIKAQ